MAQLSIPEKQHLQLLRKTSKDKRVYIKATAILLLNEGYGLEEVGSILGIDGDTVRRYEKKFLEVGLEDYLKYLYVGKTAKLSDEQISLLDVELNTYLYQTLAEIRYYILETYGVEYSKEGLRDLLCRMGYRYKKTRMVPSKADPEKQHIWVAEFEQKMIQLSDDEEIYFIDGVHPMHNTRSELGWIKKGKDYEILANSGRQRLNINGAVCIHNPELLFKVEAEKISYEANIRLFEKMLEARPDKRIIVYADNARYNHAAALKVWLTSHVDRIELRHLPPYSPNLNPIERVWKLMKKETINSYFYKTFQEFKAGVLAFFDNISNYASKLRALVTTNFQIIGNPQT